MHLLVLLLAAAVLLSVAHAVNPALKVAGQGMALLKPVFALENQLQGKLLGTLGNVDVAEVQEELATIQRNKVTCIYTYALSPFSTEALACLDAVGAKYEKRELGLEWFLLGPRASVLRAELLALTGQSSLPQVFIGGEAIGGLATGTPGLAALQESGELEAKLRAAKAL
jgi:glutaredoxin-related protein